MTATAATARSHSVPGHKIVSVLVWALGCFMTHQFFLQIRFGGEFTFLLAVVVQLVLTVAQGPVWAGRGNIISYTALALDALINFGGVLAFVSNIDQSGSFQAFTGSLIGWTGNLPFWFEGLAACFLSAIVAGAPEALWKRG